ncbi:MAG: KUP/HAK/KT family potassium transporter [Syntrophobacteraceae bacterium]
MDANDKPGPPTLKLGLALGALGVVYGDIGTSPLYAVKECFHGAHAIEASPANVMGVLSLVVWSLTIVVSIKYITFIMRADNRGEGGIFALLALVPGADGLSDKMRGFMVLAALAGAALLYGDGFITPSISVLSAIEGLEVATDAAQHLIVPLTCGVLLVLFLLQKHGTAGIGNVFGPVMLVWFTAIAALGVGQIAKNPDILLAVNPMYAYRFFAANHVHGLVVLGSVVLVITGGEALYADMGHFGKRPIRLSWFVLVFPALLLNYFGQGALLLSTPEVAPNPFYALVPRPLLYPMVGLATIATVIASQAMISGAFSLTRQAVQLGYFPRVTIIHTSETTEGQIYIPEVNWVMMIVCITLVLVFRGSSGLAGAYGVAVTANMGLTSVVYFFVATETWNWSVRKTLPLVGLFLIFDLTYFGSNLLKFFDGGWFPMAVAVVIVVIMTAWKDGRAALSSRFRRISLPFDTFLRDVAEHRIHRVSGTAVFLASSSQFTPPSLLHHYKHNQVLHEEVILLTIVPGEMPSVPERERIGVEELGNGFYRLIARYGFMETPNVPQVLNLAYNAGLIPRLDPISFYLGRETLLPTGDAKMMRWRKSLFAFLSRNSQTATNYFGIPPGQVVELGVQVEL